MLDARSAIITRTGMLITNEINVTVTKSAFGNEPRAQKRPKARVAPTGAENTALKIVASSAEASRTRPVLWRTNNRLSPDAVDCAIPSSWPVGSLRPAPNLLTAERWPARVEHNRTPFVNG